MRDATHQIIAELTGQPEPPIPFALCVCRLSGRLVNESRRFEICHKLLSDSERGVHGIQVQAVLSAEVARSSTEWTSRFPHDLLKLVENWN